ncbi:MULTISPECIES: glycoside hydrolase family 2 protein [unclassified Cryobacterium]|nr:MULTISPECIES: glycoside hydrolase family 2 protein [unclassified Cryobacterium]MDY7529961.1 glycoside hydrolase family 2 protein [Cryobacterium sp. 10C2]MDY7544496.1 glycoside hydrolase family 2 protein [Cryobacterium sp. 5B3]MEB0002530.1 glycoside hydrolase family 2 protein [Cryobacterium sp. RTC2.1]MEB0202696.1 glycoside hydrolase family 2 protein [Cryobacterium sp. 5I3]MEB0276211.1 glycoside hydrolase family 2 protein [Cryobacterium sp. 5B3]
MAGPVPEGLPRDIPATVPGTVHTDLLARGLIPDPYLNTNENAVKWIGETDVRYQTSFAFTDEGHERVDLVAEGLDTVATVTFNGALVGETKNQHRSYRFDVRSLIRASSNELTVDLASPLRSARESELRIGAKPLVADALPYNALRKMACNFGWDWGPTLTTSGIWRPLYLHQWSVARLAQVIPRVSVDSDGGGLVEVHVELERTDLESAAHTELLLEAILTAPDGTAVHTSGTVERSSSVLSLKIDNAELWWPRGYGDQPLYHLDVRVSRDAEELDTWTHDVGFRTVEVRMNPDDFGTGFEFHVNGQFVYIKGANWIPDDCFLPRVTRDDYERGVRDAVEANMNMLRIWGGGIYESNDLYDICNREGILLWQDFLFACAIYSEAPEMWAEVEAEARENVARLAPNPSLVFWNGSNENIEGYFHWGFKERMQEGETWGRGYYDDLLPSILAELDPGRGYLPSTPFSPADYADPRDPNHGPVHSWKVWFSEDYLTYRNSVPRFVAEFGFQGPADYSTLTSAIDDDPMLPDSPGMAAHQKAVDGNGKLDRGYALHLPAPTTFDDWHFATQLNQARAISCGVKHFRSHSPRTSGSLVWQLNDCWPAISWAAVDKAGRRKPLWYALRALNAPRLLLVQPRGAGLALIVSNDSPHAWTGTVAVRRLSLTGTELAAEHLRFNVASRTNQTILLSESLTVPADARNELIVAEADASARAFSYFVEDVELSLPQAEFSTTVEREDVGYSLTVTANNFVKDIVLNPDRLDPMATVDEMLVTLLPGESHRFLVLSGEELPVDDLTTRPVLQSANNLRHPAALTQKGTV